MSKYSAAQLQDMANVLIDVAVNLRNDPSDIYRDMDRLHKVVAEIDALATDYHMEITHPTIG